MPIDTRVKKIYYETVIIMVWMQGGIFYHENIVCIAYLIIIIIFILSIYIINYKWDKIKGENRENRVLHIVGKGEVCSDHSSNCFWDGHYHMISQGKYLLKASILYLRFTKREKGTQKVIN